MKTLSGTAASNSFFCFYFLCKDQDLVFWNLSDSSPFNCLTICTNITKLRRFSIWFKSTKLGQNCQLSKIDRVWIISFATFIQSVSLWASRLSDGGHLYRNAQGSSQQAELLIVLNMSAFLSAERFSTNWTTSSTLKLYYHSFFFLGC